MKNVLWMLLIFVSTIVFVACSNDEPELTEKTQYKEIQLSSRARSVTAINNSFALNLFNQTSHDSNYTLSSYGIMSILALLSNGDDAETREEIMSILGGEGNAVSIEELNDYFIQLNQELPTLDSQVEFKYANSIWNETELKTEFVNKIDAVFGAEWFKMNPSKNVSELNSWIDRKTDGFIKEFCKSPMELVSPLVANVAYFNGLWQIPFDSKNTKTGIFVNNDLSKSNVDFMSNTGSYKILENENLCAVELPYGAGNFSMVMIKPTSLNYRFDEITNYLTPDFIISLNELNIRSAQYINLSIPKFDIESDMPLDESMRAMGFYKFYNGFNNINSDRTIFQLECIKQVSRIKLTEEGTEVATVTSNALSGIPRVISFDTPFVFMIRETSTNSILYIGEIVKL